MATLRTSLALGLTLAIAAACGSSTTSSPSDGNGNGVDPRPIPSSGSANGETTSTSQLPCEVQALLASKCAQCHGARPSGAPMALVTHEQLTRKATASANYAQRALARMKDPRSPMPPAPAPRATDAEIAAFEAWVQQGAPQGECKATSGPPSSPSETRTASVCTSGKTWKANEAGSPLMHPGAACIDCHSTEEDAPRFVAAGTVYPTFREPRDCNGVDGTKVSAKVELTDAKGKTVSIPVNAAGNFFLEASGQSLTPPYRAKVIAGGKERVMKAAQTIADCNVCHSETGANGAPGRIVLPDGAL